MDLSFLKDYLVLIRAAGIFLWISSMFWTLYYLMKNLFGDEIKGLRVNGIFYLGISILFAISSGIMKLIELL